jgi:DNA invertase Pin-like site-specific DNA recombinase
VKTKRAAIYVRVSTNDQDTGLQETELKEYVESRGWSCDLVSQRQNIDTTLPAGRLTFAVLGAVAEFEREMLRERVKAGMAQARRAGKRVGRPALRHFSPQELEKMQLLRTQGTSIRKLATNFGTTQWMASRLTNRDNRTIA